MTGTTGMGEEVRSNRLNAALSCGREFSDGLEILLGRPTLSEGGEGGGDLCCGCHLVYGGGWRFVKLRRKS